MFNQPLNPALFEQLQAYFGDVKIANPGQPRRVEYLPSYFCPGGVQIIPKDRGEQYRVNCPFCGDTRQRLYLSYQFGESDPVTKSDNYGLWYCQNERCHKNRDNRMRLQAYTAIPVGRRALLPSIAPVAPEASPIGTPLQVVTPPLPPGLLLNQLPASHPAVVYLTTRGFDVHALSHCWGVGYCETSPENSFFANYRIIIPIWALTPKFAPPGTLLSQVLVGWQSRAVGDGDGREKYLNPPGLKKSHLLYGLPLAFNTTGPVWICEGATDCWQIGPGAVALFGKTLSEHQKLLTVHHFAGRPIVVLLDRDARKEAEAIQQQLQRARGLSDGDRRVMVLEVPAGRSDPGECTQAEIWDATARALGMASNNSTLVTTEGS